MYSIPAAITMNTASNSLAELRRAIDGGETEVSLGALAQSDSSALAVVLAAVRHAQSAGRKVRVTGMPPSMLTLAKLYGVEALMA